MDVPVQPFREGRPGIQEISVMSAREMLHKRQRPWLNDLASLVFEGKRLWLTFIADATIVFVVRTVVIALFRQKLLPGEIYAMPRALPNRPGRQTGPTARGH